MSKTYRANCANEVFTFKSLSELLAKANEEKSGDQLAGIAAGNNRERMAAKLALADCPLQDFIDHPVIPPEIDEVSRLLLDTYDRDYFRNLASKSVGELRDILLSRTISPAELRNIGKALTPEMVAAVVKLMSNKDLIRLASRIRNVTRLRSTIGEEGVLAIRIQPNHPSDDIKGIILSTLEGLHYGCGDAVIGVNPVIDSVETVSAILKALNQLIEVAKIPTQACCLAHITTQLECLRRGAPIDLLFQSIAGTEAANRSFGINLELLEQGRNAVLDSHQNSPNRYIGNNVMYFETGQGSALSAEAHHGVDQVTLEARAYGVARTLDPFLVNSVVGFIGPEYLYDERQIIRAGLEDHCMGKLLGLPMGCDVCYTNHATADQNSVENLMILLATAGCNFFMGVPGSDDIMLNYQSTSFHDAAFLREHLNLRPAPEFAEWLENNHLNHLDENYTFPSSISDYAKFSRPNLPSVDSPEAQSPSLVANLGQQQGIAYQLPQVSTAARILIGSSGTSYRNETQLKLRIDHAAAVDAVQQQLRLSVDFPTDWQSRWKLFEVSSQVTSKQQYLQRPDLGRKLSIESIACLTELGTHHPDVQIVIGDGLSALATIHQAPGLLDILQTELQNTGLSTGTPFFVRFCRVGIMNNIGDILKPKVIILLIGERPGLATAESLSAYLAYRPSAGHTDANRNLISNIHPGGVTLEVAASRILGLVTQMIKKEISGVELKEVCSQPESLEFSSRNIT